MVQHDLTAVYLKGGVHHDSVKMQKYLFLLPCIRNENGFGIKGRLSVIITHGGSCRRILTDILLQHIVVGKIYRSGSVFAGKLISQ